MMKRHGRKWKSYWTRIFRNQKKTRGEPFFLFYPRWLSAEEHSWCFQIPGMVGQKLQFNRNKKMSALFSQRVKKSRPNRLQAIMNIKSKKKRRLKTLRDPTLMA